MSKQQTPITAEEFLLQKCGQFVRRSNTQWYELMEQYAQAKVLEALERDIKYIEELILLDRVKDDYRNGIEKGLEISRDYLKRQLRNRSKTKVWGEQ